MSGHAVEFAERIRQRLNAAAGLARLTTRDPDDFTMALCDSWAETLGVLGFYQERIGAEAYLRTAAEQDSLRHLASLVGCQTSPALAAATYLAFTVDETAGPARIEAGTRVQSLPGAGEFPQVFETSEDLLGHASFNTLHARQNAPAALRTTAQELWIRGTDGRLQPGDPLLIIASDGAGDGEEMEWALRKISRVQIEQEDERTHVWLDRPSHPARPLPAKTKPGVWRMRSETVFGHNAPLRMDADRPADWSRAFDWQLDEREENTLALEGIHPRIHAGSWVVVERPNTPAAWQLPRAELGLDQAIHVFGIASRIRAREISALVQSGMHQLLAKVERAQIGSRARYGLSGRVTLVTLDDRWLMDDVDLEVIRGASVYVQEQDLRLAETPIEEPVEGEALELEAPLRIALEPGRRVILSGEPTSGPGGVVEHERVEVAETAPAGSRRVRWKQPLLRAYRRSSVRANANVAHATHGDSVLEAFEGAAAALARRPLTFLAGAEGIQPALLVTVDGMTWERAASFRGASAAAPRFIAEVEPEGVTVRLRGAPPGNPWQVRYRVGAGAVGNVGEGRLTVLLTRAQGVRSVTNPLAASGGAEAAPVSALRRRAPGSVKTSGRVVSIEDHAEFARAYPGIAKAAARWAWINGTGCVLLTLAGTGGAEAPPASPLVQGLLRALRAASAGRVPVRLQSFRLRLLHLSATIYTAPGFVMRDIESSVAATLTREFSFERRSFGESVALSRIVTVMHRERGVLGVDVDALHYADEEPLLRTTVVAGPDEILVLDRGLVLRVETERR